MKRYNVLVADFPLHSSHAPQHASADGSLPEAHAPPVELPPLMHQCLDYIDSRRESLALDGTKLFVSALAYPSSSASPLGVAKLPWSSSAHTRRMVMSPTYLASEDPYLYLTHLFDNLEAACLIWVITSNRIASALAISYRLSQTLRYLLDVQGIRCQVLLEEGISLPVSFKAVLESLDIPVYSEIIDIAVHSSSFYPLYSSPGSCGPSGSSISTNKANYRFTTSAGFNDPPLSFHALFRIDLRQLPLHILEGSAFTSYLEQATDENADLEFTLSKGFGIVLTTTHRPPQGSALALPKWNAASFAWEYDSTVQLPTGFLYLLYTAEEEGVLVLRLLSPQSTDSDALFLEEDSSEESMMVLSDDQEDSDDYNSQFPELPTLTEARDLFNWLALRAAVSSDSARDWQDFDPRAFTQSELSDVLRDWYRFANIKEQIKFEAGLDSEISGRFAEITDTEDLLDLKKARDAYPLRFKISTTHPEIGELSPFSMPATKHIRRSKTSREKAKRSAELKSILWERELVLAKRLERDLTSKRRRRSLGRASSFNTTGDTSPLSAFDEISNVGSESATSEPGASLLEAVRGTNSSRNSNSLSMTETSPPAVQRRLKTSQQLRHQLSRNSRSRISDSPSAERNSSNSAEMLSPHSTTSESNLSPPNNSTNITSYRRPSLTPLRPLPTLEKTSERRASPTPTGFHSRGLSPTSHALPPLRSPSPSSLGVLPPLQSSSSARKLASSSSEIRSRSSLTQSSSSGPIHAVSNEEDNKERLMNCCRAEVARSVPSSDRKFSDLVDRLFHICKIILTVKHEWSSLISNSEFLKCASSQSKQLLGSVKR